MTDYAHIVVQLQLVKTQNRFLKSHIDFSSSLPDGVAFYSATGKREKSYLTCKN